MFENPHNLGMITPPWLHFRVTSATQHTVTNGLLIDYTFRWLGLPLRWKTCITVYDPPFEFVDEALRSPYVYWRHRHTFTVVPGGTLVKDTVDYQLPWGPLGQLAHAMAVRRNLIGIFTYRQKALDAHWGGGSVIRYPTVQPR
ncbi:MAG TPA: SRPBCC family protein [Bryobacteraceae bacterium]|nr:SRPBCC family protein [Bryobacteraceae bacterium]